MHILVFKNIVIIIITLYNLDDRLFFHNTTYIKIETKS